MISPVGNYAPNGEVPANMQRVPGGGASSWNTAFSQANGMPINNKWDPAGQQAYLRQIAGNNPTQSRFNMPNGTQQAIGQGAQQNQQQQLMALLSQLFNRG